MLGIRYYHSCVAASGEYVRTSVLAACQPQLSFLLTLTVIIALNEENIYRPTKYMQQYFVKIKQKAIL